MHSWDGSCSAVAGVSMDKARQHWGYREATNSCLPGLSASFGDPEYLLGPRWSPTPDTQENPDCAFRGNKGSKYSPATTGCVTSANHFPSLVLFPQSLRQESEVVTILGEAPGEELEGLSDIWGA